MKSARLLVCALVLALLPIACDRQPGPDQSYRSAAPVFTVAYPDSWKPEKPRYPGESFRATAAMALPTIAISTYAQSDPKMINEHYPDQLVGYLKALFPRASDFKVLSSRLVALADGTQASETSYQWTWEDGATHLASFTLAAVKDNTLVSVTCTGMADTAPEVLAKYPRTLSFGK